MNNELGEAYRHKIDELKVSSMKDVGHVSEKVRDIEKTGMKEVNKPDIYFIEHTARSALFALGETLPKEIESGKAENLSDNLKMEGLSDNEKARIKEETGWSDEVIENIKNMEQYEILKNAGLKEVEINGRKCLIKEDIELDYTDEDGISNRQRIALGLAPLNSKTGAPLELHHLGQKADSPLVELTEEEHRTGEYENGKKNQSLWHNNTIETEVHGEGNNWNQERKAHWEVRSEEIEGGNS